MITQIIGYRDWAVDLHRQVERTIPVGSWVYLSENIENVQDGADLTFLVGWSSIVPLEFYENRTVIVLHPSPLPKYRGGSPIQNQIIAGEKMSAVTLFRLDPAYPAVDSGPILSSRPYSLEGNLSTVLDRIARVGALLVKRAIEDFVDGSMHTVPQDESQATTFKRRRPAESEIRREELFEETYALENLGLALHNKVRALQDPYPNAYLRFPDGRLYITQTRWEPNTDSVDQRKVDQLKSEIRTKDGKPV